MAKLRHIAISVPDLEKSAAFYEQTFGLKRVNFVVTPYGDGLSLSDGVINLTLLHFHTDEAAGDERGRDFVGIHHIGFQVESLEKTAEKLAASVAKPRDDINVALGLGAGGAQAGHGNVEVRYSGPDNVTFDVSQTGWVGTPTNKVHG